MKYISTGSYADYLADDTGNLRYVGSVGLGESRGGETASSDSEAFLANPEPSNHYPHCHGESCPCESCEEGL